MLHNKRFPGESRKYRGERNKLLEEEIKLRRHAEKVASMRRKLPPGGEVKQDYIFQEGWPESRTTKLSELFVPGKDTLVVYGFMYKPDDEYPCTSCTSILDGMNGQSPHVNDRVNFVVISKAPAEKLQKWAETRGWNNLRILSSNKNSFNKDYHSEDEQGYQLPALNVFQKTSKGIFHTYNTELLYAKPDKGQNARHVDFIWPLWNIFDFTPEGRGEDWYPKFSYDTSPQRRPPAERAGEDAEKTE